MTNALCREICAAKGGYDVAGTLQGRNCYCGLAKELLELKLVPDSKCFVPCDGDASDVCGGSDAFSLYLLAYQFPPFAHLGCLQEPAYPLLPHQSLPTHAEMTNEVCQDSCFQLGFSAAGVKEGKSCFCGSASAVLGRALLDEGRCSLACRGDNDQSCGGPDALDVFVLNGYEGRVEEAGCYDEASHHFSEYQMFPKLLYSNGNALMSRQYCLSQCERRGLPVAGLPWDSMCFCGTDAHVEAYQWAKTSEAKCNMSCYGKQDELCGAKFVTRALALRTSSAETSREAYERTEGVRPAKGKAGRSLDPQPSPDVNGCRLACLTDARCWSVAAEPLEEGGFLCHPYIGIDARPVESPGWHYLSAQQVPP